MAYEILSDEPAGRYEVLPSDEPVTKAGKSLNRGLADVPRQLGLTARYALEGPAQAAQILTEPIAGLMRSAGIPTKSLGQLATGLANTIGLPNPESAQERVVGDAARLVAGSGGVMGAAGAASRLPGMAGVVGTGLAANPAQQLSGAAGAGLAGGLSREGGGSEAVQTGAALLGGLAGSAVPGAVQSAASLGRRMVGSNMAPAAIDSQISMLLERTGMDYSQVPERARQALRAELSGALQAGREVDPAAVRRLAEFQTIGATPTRGMVSQDPVQITREMNLAKTGANSADGGLQGLARIQNQNNTRLIDVLNEGGAARGDQFAAGQRVVDTVAAQNAAREAAKNRAYQQLEQMPGFRAPMSPAPISNINRALGEEAAMPFMPREISNYMESFLQPNGPQFTPQAYNNLQKMLSGASTSQDGNVRNAVRVAMRELENTPITAANGIPAETGAAANAAIQQLQTARGANRDWRQWQESSRPVTAAVNGADPDKFLQKFVINGPLTDAQAVAQTVPPAQVKDAIMNHLKEKALSGASDEVGKFSQSAYNKALNQIGDRKLALFFSPEEIQQMRTVGRVSSYMQNQPVGSAVNNSNSGALLLGRGIDLLNHVPVIGPMVGPALQNMNITMQQRAAQNVLPGLLTPMERQPISRGLLSPSLAMGGLLSAPGPNDGQDR